MTIVTQEFDTGPIYAPLFRPMRYEFVGNRTSSRPEEGEPTVEVIAGIVCRSTPEPVDPAAPDVRRTTLACSANGGASPFPDGPDGTFVVTPAGLWFGAVGAPETMLIAATPATRRSEVKLEEGGVRIYQTREVERAWCFGITEVAVDTRGWEMCLKVATGIVSGNAFVTNARDGATHDVKYTRK